MLEDWTALLQAKLQEHLSVEWKYPIPNVRLFLLACWLHNCSCKILTTHDLWLPSSTCGLTFIHQHFTQINSMYFPHAMSALTGQVRQKKITKQCIRSPIIYFYLSSKVAFRGQIFLQKALFYSMFYGNVHMKWF